MPVIIDGKKTSEEIKNEIANRVQEIKANGGKVPHLAAVLVGEDPASQTYVGAKVKACEQVGYASTLVRLGEGVRVEELLVKIEVFDENPVIMGWLGILPLSVRSAGETHD